jgi:hypothetical protein
MCLYRWVKSSEILNIKEDLVMKRYLSLIIVVLIAAACPALTIFQTWDVSDWTLYFGSNAYSGTVITPRPNEENYLYTNMWRNEADSSVTAIYISLGDANIPAGTTAGNVQEFWLQYDYQAQSGDPGKYAVMFGIFNSAGDNDNIPITNLIGIQNTGTDRSQATRKNSADGMYAAASITIYGDDSPMYRLKAHIYNSGGRTLMDANLYGVDPNTFELHPALNINSPSGSVTGFVVLDTGQSFDQGMDVFGVINVIGPLSARNEFKFDNMYFSTEGPKEDPVPYPSYGKVCNDDTADYTGDCKVTFEDFAVFASKWMECAYIPARLCD